MKINKTVPILCVLAGVLLAAVTALTEGDKKETVKLLARPSVGNEKEDYQLNVAYDGIEGTIEVSLNERRLSFEEAQEYFGRGQEELIRSLEEGNGSLDSVSEDLYLPDSVLGGALDVVWRSGDRQFIRDDGTLVEENCGNIGVSGQVVLMLAAMSVQDYKAELEIPICIVCPELSEQEAKLELIREEVERAAVGSELSEVVELPAEVAGKRVEYYRLAKKSWWKFIVLGVMAAMAYVLSGRQKAQKEKEKREKELQLAYAPIITKFTLLVGAGITIKGAWEKLVSDYKKGTKKNSAYEEMLKVYNEMQNGLSEGQAYVAFGKRCKLSPYVKFGNLLEQNLRKGTRGLMERLEHEVWEAFEERKALAYRLGDEASTKLLLPMVLSLGIVIAFCVVPAFLNI